ncbi:MAG: hypothetical protein IJW63_10090 [Lachnospiraceae bacterium]|nr:hypothetical protein [Lachnospiraceae bacterium]
MSRPKQFLILFLSLITMMGLLTGCGIIPTTIVGEVDPSVYSWQPTERQIPDLGTFFARQRAATRALEEDSEGSQIVTINPETDQSIVLEYINLLLSDTYGFQICNDFDLSLDDPFNGEFGNKWSIAFESTRLDAGKRITNGNSIPCDLCLSLNGQNLILRYSDVFSIKDFGDRYTGAPKDTLLDFTGRSAGSFVKHMGSYHTGDAKFSVKANVRESYKYIKNYVSYEAFKGEGSIIYNQSEPSTGKALLTVDNRKDTDSYTVEVAYITLEDFLDFTNGEKLTLALPVVNEQGMVYRFTDFFSNHQGTREKSCFYFSFTPSEMKETIYRTPLRDIVSHIESLTVRIIQWDATGEEDCVLYLHSLMYQDGEPIEIECLISGRLNSIDNMEKYQEAEASSSDSKSWSIFDDDDDDDGPYIPDHAKLDCLTCGGDGDCNTCNGYGEWRRYNSVVSTCNSCNGSGNCRTCGGSGKR